MFISRDNIADYWPSTWRKRSLWIAAIFFLGILINKPGRALLSVRSSPTVHFLLPIGEPNALFCQSLFTAFLHDFRPVLVNFNTTESREAKGNRFKHMALKVHGVNTYLALNVSKDEDIVIMADAMDVWWQLPFQEVIDRYVKMDAPLVFSAEKNCAPYHVEYCEGLPESPLLQDAYGPETDRNENPKFNRPRWLNSGLIIGRAHHLRRVFQFARNTQMQGDLWNDQEIMAHAYHSAEYDISLDFRSELFQSVYAAEEDIVWRELNSGRIVELPDEQQHDSVGSKPRGAAPQNGGVSAWLDRILSHLRTSGPSSLLRVVDAAFPIALASNNITSSVFAAIHFNGGGYEKLHSIPFWMKMWWVRLGRSAHNSPEAAFVRQKVEEGYVKIAEDGRRVGWQELCGELMPLDWLATDPVS